jgi:hypothetical protein
MCKLQPEMGTVYLEGSARLLEFEIVQNNVLFNFFLRINIREGFRMHM